MQPPILRWKVFLALAAVVIGACVLGGALRSTSDAPASGMGVYVAPGPGSGVASLLRLFSAASVPAPSVHTVSIQVAGINRIGSAGPANCTALKKAIRTMPKTARPYFRQAVRQACHKHR